ncbi:phage protein [Clostridium putrefaciens]|uniref:Phage protein n=1 Tax=Clostridium putrefaciens TaxID=99675 RepID=A0A381J739_9CLOT|nr:hypothetical protein [Clostridium putrefaciens]SUY47051.1 phage protein [Clostridium putrefaciens]
MEDGKIIIDTKIDDTGMNKGIDKLNSIVIAGLKLVKATGISGVIKVVGGLAENMAKIIQDKLAGSVEQLGSGLETLGLTAYEKFQGPMEKAIDVAIESVDCLINSLNDGDLGNIMDKIAEGFGNLVENMAKLIEKWLPKIIEGFAWIMNHSSIIMAGIYGIGTALITLNVANMIMGLIKAFEGVKTATEAWSVVQKLLNVQLFANPTGLIIAIIAGVVVAIVYLWNTSEDFRNFVIGAWDAILYAGKGVWEWLVNFFTEYIPNAFQTVLDFFIGIPYWFVDLWIQIKQSFLDGWNNISNFFTETIPMWIQQIFCWFNELPHMIGFALSFVLVSIIKWGIDTWNYLETNVPIWMQNVGMFFSALPGMIFIWLDNTITNIISWGSQMYNNMVNSATNAINAVIQWFSTLPSSISTWLANTITNVIQFGSNLCAAASQAGDNMVTNIIGVVQNLPAQFEAIGTNIVKGVWHGITSMGSWIADRVNGFFTGIIDGAKSALGIHSPSRVFRDQVGAMMAKGVGLGFEDETKDIQNDMQKNLSDLTAKMTSTVNYETSRTSSGVVARGTQGIITDIATSEDIKDGDIFMVKNYMDSEEISEYTYKKTDGKFAMAGKRVR